MDMESVIEVVRNEAKRHDAIGLILVPKQYLMIEVKDDDYEITDYHNDLDFVLEVGLYITDSFFITNGKVYVLDRLLIYYYDGSLKFLGRVFSFRDIPQLIRNLSENQFYVLRELGKQLDEWYREVKRELRC